jgi:hypothetical protein
LFIRGIDEWDSVATPATLDHLLGMGAGPLIASRIGGFLAAVMISATLIGGLVLAPFVVIGGWARRRSVEFGPYLAYAAALFGFSAIVSAVHVPGGTFIHSAVALAPHGYILALEGVAIAVTRWTSRRRATDPERAIRLTFVTVLGVLAAGAALSSASVHATWGGARDDYLAVDAALDAAGASPSDRVMSIDAAGTRYWTGRGGVVLPNDPLTTIADVAAAYDIRWLVLHRDAVASTTPILDGQRPAWLGPPILQDGDPVQLAVFPVDREGMP